MKCSFSDSKTSKKNILIFDEHNHKNRERENVVDFQSDNFFV